MAIIVVTQNWSGTRRAIKSFDQTFDAVFVVSGTGDENAAIAAALAHDTPYGPNPNMRAGHRWAEPMGPQVWKVYAHYSFGDHGLAADSPLLENPVIRWEPCQELAPNDVDVNKNAIVNAAGDPFNPPPPMFIPSPILCIRRYEASYSIAYAIEFIDHVNSAEFSVSGAGSIGKGNAYCLSYKPTEDYTLAAPYVPVEYRFQFKPGTDPWQLRIANLGRNAWYNDAATSTNRKGPICDYAGNAITFDVLLGMDGIPIDPQFRFALGPAGTPKPTVVNPSAPPGLTKYDDFSSASIITLLWKNKASADFLSLGI